MFDNQLDRAKKAGLHRKTIDRASAQGRVLNLGGRDLINFASNDYLGLASHPRLKEAAQAALGKYGTGAGASRLLGGGTILTSKLEQKTASYKGTPAALVLNSGYVANTGALPAIADKGDAIFSDELNHASLIDGCRLSGADTHIYRHGDLQHLEQLLSSSKAKQRVVVTDSVFSMDGDMAPLPDIYALCDKYNAILYIDDAHATGVLGTNGRGSLSHFALAPAPNVIQMGTFSKALGSFGAYIAAEQDVIDWLINSARSFIYSTALPPATVAASIAAIEMTGADDSHLNRLWANHKMLTDGLRINSQSPIIPIMFKSVEDTMTASQRLMDKGFYAPAIRPPTVKEPRIRITVTAAHTEQDIKDLIAALA